MNKPVDSDDKNANCVKEKHSYKSGLVKWYIGLVWIYNILMWSTLITLGISYYNLRKSSTAALEEVLSKQYEDVFIAQNISLVDWLPIILLLLTGISLIVILFIRKSLIVKYIRRREQDKEIFKKTF